MTKREFMERYFEKGKFKYKSEAERVLNDILDLFGESLNLDGEVNFIGWGKFYVVDRAAREAKNPKTGEVIKVAPKKVVKFKVGKSLSNL